jgi:hypothetical protein
MDFRRPPPPPGMIAAAEQEYHAARDELDGLIHAVHILLDGGVSEIETVTHTWMSLKVQQSNPIMLLVCAAAIVRLAKTSPSEPAPGATT